MVNKEYLEIYNNYLKEKKKNPEYTPKDSKESTIIYKVENDSIYKDLLEKIRNNDNLEAITNQNVVPETEKEVSMNRNLIRKKVLTPELNNKGFTSLLLISISLVVVAFVIFVIKVYS